MRNKLICSVEIKCDFFAFRHSIVAIYPYPDDYPLIVEDFPEKRMFSDHSIIHHSQVFSGTK